MSVTQNYRLNFIEKGRGKPLILLHGNGEDHTYFDKQIDFFSTTRRVIAIDTRGHGLSPRGTEPFTVKQFADDLYCFFLAHNITKADILGFSDGGNIALLFAIDYPDFVDKLILNGANLNRKGLIPSVTVFSFFSYAFHSCFARFSAKSKRKKIGFIDSFSARYTS